MKRARALQLRGRSTRSSTLDQRSWRHLWRQVQVELNQRDDNGMDARNAPSVPDHRAHPDPGCRVPAESMLEEDALRPRLNEDLESIERDLPPVTREQSLPRKKRARYSELQGAAVRLRSRRSSLV